MKRHKPIRVARVLLLILLAPILALQAGCARLEGGTPEESHPSEPWQVELMTSWTAGSKAATHLGVMLAQLAKDRPDILVTHEGMPSADLRARLTTRMATGNPPDLSWCVLSYAREYIKDGKIIDWRPVFDDPRHPEFRTWFDEKALSSATLPDGRIIMVPQEASVDGLYYDTALFEQNGWRPPRTFVELLDLVGKAREKGMVGIAVGGKDMRFAWLASALLVRTAGLQRSLDLCLGGVPSRYSDPLYGFPGAMERFKELVDAGAFSPNVLGMSAAEADAMFADNQAALYYEGAWKPDGFEVAGTYEFVERLARVDFPSIPGTPRDAGVNVGGNIIGFFIADKLPEEQMQACIEVAKRIASPGFNIPIMEAGGFVYAGRADYDESKVSPVMNQLIRAYREADGFIPSMDALAPPSVDLAIKQNAMPGILSGLYTVEQAVAEVERVAREYLDASRR